VTGSDFLPAPGDSVRTKYSRPVFCSRLCATGFPVRRPKRWSVSARFLLSVSKSLDPVADRLSPQDFIPVRLVHCRVTGFISPAGPDFVSSSHITVGQDFSCCLISLTLGPRHSFSSDPHQSALRSPSPPLGLTVPVHQLVFLLPSPSLDFSAQELIFGVQRCRQDFSSHPVSSVFLQLCLCSPCVRGNACKVRLRVNFYRKKPVSFSSHMIKRLKSF
jgi:hypothetical protein